MKTCAAVLCLFFLSAIAAQAQTPAPASQQAAPGETSPAPSADYASAIKQIDPAKAADIQRLLEAAGMRQLMEGTMQSMETNMRPTLESALPPGDYRARLLDLFFQKLQTKLTIQEFLDMAAVAYDKYLTDDDIKGLIAFYQTPLGQKTLTILPKLTAELQAEGSLRGEQAAGEAMTEVLTENPDLAKALQDAAGNAAPPTN